MERYFDTLRNCQLFCGITDTELFTMLPCLGARAAESAEVMLIDCMKIICSCSSACEFHQRMICNPLKVVAEKNLAFHQKIEITSKRTTKEKLLTYPLLQAKKSEEETFEIPYNRQELADYLALSGAGCLLRLGNCAGRGSLQPTGSNSNF